MLTILLSSNPPTVKTSWHELPPSKWYPFNSPVFLDQQYSFDTHFQTDCYPSNCCLWDHLPLCTIQQPSFRLCSSVSIPLAIGDGNRELLHLEVTIADVILIFVYREYSNVCFHCIITPLQLGCWGFSHDSDNGTWMTNRVHIMKLLYI